MTQDKVSVEQIITDAIATGVGLSKTIRPWQSKKVFHAHGIVSATTGASTIQVQGSNDGTNWIILDTLSLTLGVTVAAASQDFFVLDAPWKYIRGNVATISGTNATVQLFISTAG